jgi:hypothetical protein
MPRYEVKVVRIVSYGEYAWIEVEADDEYHAKALALEQAEDDDDDTTGWRTRESWIADGGETEAEYCREVKDEHS